MAVTRQWNQAGAALCCAASDFKSWIHLARLSFSWTSTKTQTTNVIWYDMTILISAQKLTDASLIYRTGPKTKTSKMKKLKTNGYPQKKRCRARNHGVSRQGARGGSLGWKWFVQQEGFEPGVKQRRSDEWQWWVSSGGWGGGCRKRWVRVRVVGRWLSERSRKLIPETRWGILL